MALDFKLPDIGEGVVEGEIVEWHVSPGDSVTHDQPIVSVLTDKATVEISCPVDGSIDSLLCEPGDVVEVGTPICVIQKGDAAAEDSAPKEEPAPKNTSEAGSPKPASGESSQFDFKLPEIGEGVVEGEIVEWHVAAGDQIEHDSPMVSVLTDKATVEITAPRDARIVELFAEAGDIVEVGNKLLRLEVSGSAGADEAATAPAQEAASTSAAPKSEESQPQAAAAAVSSGQYGVDPADNPSVSAFGIPLATPAVRRFASEKGIELARVKGSGPNNRITMNDVKGALEGASAPTSEAATRPTVDVPALQLPDDAAVERQKIRGLRKAIFGSMTRSKAVIPHFTYVDEIEMDKLMAIRSELKPAAQEAGVKLTYLPFIAKAVTLALKEFPIMNASVDEDAGEIVLKKYYNIGIATATQHGLMVPVVHQADKKNIVELARDIGDVSGRARDLKASRDDLSDGTFTITSLGRLGGLMATPIINHPEVAIFSVHNIIEKPVVRDGQIVIRNMMNVAVAFDHRVIDGDVGASFTQAVKSYLEQPSKLLLHLK